MALSTRLLEALDPVHRAGLNRIRQGSAMLLARRDKGAPVMHETRDLPILEGMGPSARLFTPENADPVGPALIFFHGGGFVLGGLESHEAMCRRLAEAGRMRMILATYRLAPEFAFPAQLEDAADTVQWVMVNAPALGIDVNRIALGGDSAGGYLAIALTAALNTPERSLIKATTLFYPVLHLEDGAWANTVFTDSRVLGRLAIRYISAQFAGHPPPSLYGSANAMTPPTIITVGGAMDPVRPDVLEWAREVRGAGVDVTLFEHALLPHGYGNLSHVSADARKAITEVGEATGRVLGTLPA